jgi:Flp pilus assembly protein TadD
LAAIQNGARDWQTHSALGIAYDILGRHHQARDSYSAALTVAPDNPTVLNNLALSHALTGEVDQGIAILARVATAYGSTAQLRQNLALLYAMKGDTAKAAEIARRDLSPDEIANNLDYFRRYVSDPGKR